MSDAAREIKHRQRLVWSAGDWDAMSALIEMVGPVLLDRVGVERGTALLDVGCGTGGSVAIPAAQRGAVVVGCDLTPEHFPIARRRAAAVGVQVEWVEADAEALPFEDGRFDRVCSTFGHMFAPRHEVAAAELARVCAGDGAIALATWLDGTVPSALLRAMASDAPPPPGMGSTLAWGDRGHVRAMFAPHGFAPAFDEAAAPASFADLDAAVAFYEGAFGGLALMRTSLDPAAYADKVATVREVIAAANEATDGSVHFEAGYLISILRRA